MSRRLGRIDVSLDLIAQVLYFPAGVRVVDIRISDSPDVAELLIEGPELREVPDGAVIPSYTATVVDPQMTLKELI